MKNNCDYFYKKITDSTLSPSAIAIYKTLLQHANRTTWSCFPSVKRIGNDTHLSERTVRRQLNNLEKEKYIHYIIANENAMDILVIHIFWND